MMTEATENGYNNGTVLVRLRAVAMERDDNSEGWVPIGAGGLSNVCVVKRTIPVPILSSIPDTPTATSTSSLPGAPSGVGQDRVNNSTTNLNGRFEFVIYANRLVDDQLVFRCVICKDFEYNKVMPTFHNWKSGGKRVGLIFQTAADGRVFDRGIMGVLVDLSSGLDVFPPSSLNSVEGDNEVFMAVDLPYKYDNNKHKSDVSCSSRHVSPTSTDSPPVSDRQKQLSPNEQIYTYQPAAPPPPLLPHHNRIFDSVKTRSSCFPPPSPPPPLSSHNPVDTSVIFKKQIPGHSEMQFSSNVEKPQSLTCRHCRKTYTQEENVKGSCEYAPDCVRTSIDTVTCIPCARSMVYHCMPDSEGNFAQQLCECETVDNGCVKRWLGLAILSILLPCLWCYPPLKVCHLCGVSCGACGGRHEPENSPSTATS